MVSVNIKFRRILPDTACHICNGNMKYEVMLCVMLGSVWCSWWTWGAVWNSAETGGGHVETVAKQVTGKKCSSKIQTTVPWCTSKGEKICVFVMSLHCFVCRPSSIIGWSTQSKDFFVAGHILLTFLLRISNAVPAKVLNLQAYVDCNLSYAENVLIWSYILITGMKCSVHCGTFEVLYLWRTCHFSLSDSVHLSFLHCSSHLDDSPAYFELSDLSCRGCPDFFLIPRYLVSFRITFSLSYLGAAWYLFN